MNEQHNIQIEGHQVHVTCLPSSEVTNYTVRVSGIPDEALDSSDAVLVKFDCPRCSERISAEFKQPKRMFAAESSGMETIVPVTEYLMSLVQSGVDVFRASIDEVVRGYAAYNIGKGVYSRFQKSRGQK